MARSDEYRAKLRGLSHWDSYLLEHSGLPGPRGNLELAGVVADEGDRALFLRYLTFTTDVAPTNDPGEFLALCGTVGLGRLLSEGDAGMLTLLKDQASDSRWRLREGVAMALQRWGDVDMAGLLREMRKWSKGTWLEQRAVVAALCEPRLLKVEKHARAVLTILGQITASLERARNRQEPNFRTLRQALGYGWSVAAAAFPGEGKKAIEAWLKSEDADVHWIMRENLKKARLVRMDPVWHKAMVQKARTFR